MENDDIIEILDKEDEYNELSELEVEEFLDSGIHGIDESADEVVYE